MARDLPGAERAVKIERRNPRNEIEPLRKHHLKNVARRDVFLAALYAAQKFRTRGSRVDLELSRRGLAGLAPHCWPQACSQLSFESGNIAHCPVIGTPRIFSRNVCRSHNVNLVAQVIKSQQPVEEHQFTVGKREIVLRMFANLFQLPHNVVGKISDGPGGEWRQPRNCGRLVLASAEASRTRNTLPLALAPPSAFDFNGRPSRPQPHVRPRSQKCVAADLLAALDRLQQERMWFVFCNRQKRRDRREQVGAHRFHHRHQRCRARQAGEFLEIRVLEGRHEKLEFDQCRAGLAVHYRGRILAVPVVEILATVAIDEPSPFSEDMEDSSNRALVWSRAYAD